MTLDEIARCVESRAWRTKRPFAVTIVARRPKYWLPEDIDSSRIGKCIGVFDHDLQPGVVMENLVAMGLQ